MFLFDSGQTDNAFFGDAVIEKHEVTFGHRAEIVARLKIADARPGGALFFEERFPRVGFRFLFHEPVIHARAGYTAHSYCCEEKISFAEQGNEANFWAACPMV